MNIAAAALGGHVESVTSESERPDWKAANLIDGGGSGTCAPLCAWSPAETFAFPQEIVLSFYERREATVTAVMLDTLTGLTRETTFAIPREVEIWVSTTSPAEGFTRVGSATLPPEAGEHTIAFAPVRARYLKVRILSNQRLSHLYLGEIVVAEDGASPSILRDFPRNLALPALGGALVSFTSQYAFYQASRIADGDPAVEWRSNGNYLPQEFVFAFHNGGEALVDRVVLASRAEVGSALTLPKTVSIAVSLDSPVDGFEEVGRFELKATSDDQPLPVGRRARFLRLRILETAGPSGAPSQYSRLGEVQILEGTAPGYESVLFRDVDSGATRRPAAPAADEDPAVRAEAEPNDSAAQANALDLGATVRGTIEPLGEHDFFKVSFPRTAGNVLTLALAGRPYIRTSVALLDAAGEVRKRFDPSRARTAEETVSWLVEPGEYLVDLTEPPVSMVLVWDTSGSMRGSVDGLQRAVSTYLDQVRPGERLNLIRFSTDVEVLLPEFASDRNRLKKAAEGKFYADGATPFYDAVAKGISLLANEGGNRAVIVMTDGEDTTSRIEYPEFWRLLRRSGIRIYTIGLGQLERHAPRIGTSPARLLASVAAATGGRSFFAKTSEELAGLYQAISDELRAVSAYRIRLTPSEALGKLTLRATGERIAAVATPTQIELILDASGSMKRRIGGRMMIDLAKAVLADIVNGLPDDVQVALRVYGHRTREGRPGACRDSQLVQPFGRLDKGRLVARINSINAVGTTPIAYSLQEVGRDLKRSPGPKYVVLVTDGKEECGGNPADAVAALKAEGIDVRLNVVGFGLADDALEREMTELAGITGGRFVDAKDAAALRAAIEQALAVPFSVLDGSGAQVRDGVIGQGSIELPDGVYTVVVHASGEPLTIERVRIAPRQVTTVLLKKEGREIGVSVGAPASP